MLILIKSLIRIKSFTLLRTARRNEFIPPRPRIESKVSFQAHESLFQ